MAFIPNTREFQGSQSDAIAFDAGLRAYMLRVYNWMASGLALTGIVAILIANSSAIDYLYRPVAVYGGTSYQITGLGYLAIFAPLGFVLLLSFGITRLSTAAAQAVFWAYCAVMGASLTSIFLVYTDTSIARTFFITAGTFAAMSLYGYTTKTDLTKMGSFLMMAVLGLIIAMLVNMVVHSQGMDLLISVIGVLVFTGLTAFRTQRIRNNYISFAASASPDLAAKRSVLDALGLYLSFVNLFLMMLRLTGGRRG